MDATAGYTPAGALAKMTYGNGLVELSYYNNRLQPMQLRTYNPATSTDVLNLSYGFTNSAGANNGNVISFTSVATQIFMRSYTYDELNRLSTLSSPADASGCTGLSWTYDAWGNRLSQTVTSGTCGSPSYTLSAANRIIDTGFVHDAAGNMTHDVTHAYTFDAENHIATVDGTGATYVYDASGQRVRKTAGGVTTDYIYDASGSVVAEIQGTTWTKGYAYAGGKMIAQYNGALNASGATTLFAHADHLGSTRVMTTVAAGVSDSMDYLPYGELLGGGSSTTHKFTGKERDTESGLDDFGARYYSSSLGRFVSADWSATPEPVPYADFNDPQSLNLYTYVRNVPTSRIDADGHSLLSVLLQYLGSTYVKMSAGVGGEAGTKVGGAEAKIGGSATYNLESSPDAKLQASTSIEVGATVKAPGTPEVGPSVEKSQVTMTLHNDRSITGKEPSTTTVSGVAGKSGAEASISSDHRAGVGVSVGFIVIVKGEVGVDTNKLKEANAAAAKDPQTQVAVGTIKSLSTTLGLLTRTIWIPRH